MKIFRKIFIGLIFIGVFSLAGLYILIRLYGQQMLEEKLSQALQRTVVVKDVSLAFPLDLRLDGLEIKEFLTAREVRVQLRPPILVNRQFVVKKLRMTEPVLAVKRTKEAKITWVELAGSGKTKIKGSEELSSTQEREPFGLPGRKPASAIASLIRPGNIEGLIIDYLEIKDGKMHFTDLALKENLQIHSEKIQLKARAITYPNPSNKIKFDITALITSDDIPFSGSRIESRGWINFSEKSMEGTLKVIEPDGGIGLMADLDSFKNDMSVRGKIDVHRLVQKRKGRDLNKPSFEGMVWETLDATGLEIAMDFAFQTKMDNFKMDALPFSGGLVQKAQGQDSEQDVAADLKAIGKKFEALGQKLYKENIQDHSPAIPAKEGLAE